MAPGSGIANRANEKEVAGVPVPFSEVSIRLDEQRVSGAYFDIADLALKSLAVTGDSQDGSLIAAPEHALSDGLAHRRAGAGHDRLEKQPLMPGRVQLEDLVRGEFEAALILQVADRINNARD